MASCTDEDGRWGRGMSNDELKLRKEEIEKIAGGKGATSQTIHEWSYEGAKVMSLPDRLARCRA